MCCIIYVPAGVELPAINILEKVYYANQHGMGYADGDGHSCHTLSFAQLTRKLHERNINAPCIIHFRLATHGSISRKNCHPFYDAESGVWFAHNGILPIASHDDMTDSEIFFRERFLPYMAEVGYDSDELWDFVNIERCSSRFIFMKDHDVRMFGSWHSIDNVYYSNLNWLARYRW